MIDSEPDADLCFSAAKFLDSGRNLKEAEINDNHDEHSSKNSVVAHNDMKTRVKYQTLTSHHGPPAEGGERRVELPWTATDEPFEYDTERMAGDAPGSDQ